MPACQVCTSPDLVGVEALGREALQGSRSWRSAGAAAEMRPEALKNHMQKHVVAPAVAEAQSAAADQMDLLIEDARQGLMKQFTSAPVDVKPLILVAIQNLDGIRHTKPSQDSLIRALKTVQEMTGMKNEQRLLLGFAEAMFNKKELSPAPIKVLNEAE